MLKKSDAIKCINKYQQRSKLSVGALFVSILYQTGV